MTALKKIALLTDGVLPYVIGGMQKHSYYLAKYFAKNKVFVDLYHFWSEKEHDIHALKIFTEEERKYIRSIVLDFPEIRKLPGHYLVESYQFSELIYDKLDMDVDFIYAQGLTGWHLLKQKRNGVITPPVGVNFHGMESFQDQPNFQSWIRAFMLRPSIKFNLKYSDFVFSFGGKIRKIVDHLRIPNEKVIELPLGIEPSWLIDKPFPTRDVRRFVFLGRYERRKGIEELSEVLNNILDKEKFEFHFIGPIAEPLRIKSDQIRYWGLQTDPESIKSLLRACDVLVVPSHSEGMPNVILEAMASGLAIISSDVGAIGQIVSAQNGWLIPPANTDRLQNAILEAIHIEEEELDRKKNIARLFVEENLLWEKVIEGTIGKISECLEQNLTRAHPEAF